MRCRPVLGLDPLLALRKFARFATLDPASNEAANFVALETGS